VVVRAAGGGAPGRTGYAGAADAWATDACLAYQPLARHLIGRYLDANQARRADVAKRLRFDARSNDHVSREACPPNSPARTLRATPGQRWSEPNGIRALDVGTGTGAAADLLRNVGATVVGIDLEPDMARYAARSGPTLVADAVRLPFANGSFDLVVAAFVISHLPDPVAGLRELRRVIRPGGAVAGSVFSLDRSAAKNAVDLVAADYGYVAPDWYRDFHRYADRLGSVEGIRIACDRAGFSSVSVTAESIDVGLNDPALVVRYRLGMPQLRRFVETLSAADRARLTADATAAVRRSGDRFAPQVVEVIARR